MGVVTTPAAQQILNRGAGTASGMTATAAHRARRGEEMGDAALWSGVLNHLRRHQPTICRQWFEELEPLGIAAGALHLRVHSAVHRDYLRRQCAELFNDAARTVSGRLLSVRFLAPEDAAPVPEAKAPAPGALASPEVVVRPGLQPAAPSSPRPPAAPAPGGDALIINPDYGFENFVVGPGNRLAHAAAVAVAANPGRAYNPLFLHGGVGLGKTHLLQAVCLRLAQARPGIKIHYVSCEAFVTQFITAVQGGEMNSFRHRFRDADALVIDDIHFLAKRDRTQEEFFHTFNSLYQAGKQIVLSSDAAPEEIPDLEDRLVSRFKCGLVAKVEPPDYETRVAILKAKAAVRGLTLPDDVANLIAGRVDTNIRELEGAIGTLQIRASVEGRAIDIALARESLGRPAGVAAPEPSIQAIIDAVTDFYRVRLVDLQSARRQRSVAQPRQVCMYLIRRMTRHSLEEIGGYFGNRDHTTVMHAVRTVQVRRDTDARFDAVLRSLQERLAPTAP